MKKVFSLFLLTASVAVCTESVSAHEEVGSAKPVEAEADVWGPVAPDVVEEPTASANTQQPVIAAETPEDVEQAVG